MTIMRLRLETMRLWRLNDSQSAVVDSPGERNVRSADRLASRKRPSSKRVQGLGGGGLGQRHPDPRTQTPTKVALLRLPSLRFSLPLACNRPPTSPPPPPPPLLHVHAFAMPEVRRGSRPHNAFSDPHTPASPTSPISLPPLLSPSSLPPATDAAGSSTPTRERNPMDHALTEASRRGSNRPQDTSPRKSLAYEQREPAPVYHDSRAATHQEFRRRPQTLQEYYDDNPHLLPQLPFTWHHGWKRWRLMLLIFFMFVDACAVPIALYYGMHYAGNVEGWIIFAVVTTIWGGPTYLEFGIRTLRLIKKERFYRPLGTDSRWSFDMVTWASTATITAVTALFVVGSAPHIVWLRVLCMPGPAILYCLGGILGLITLYDVMGWKAPCRISSTAKGETVMPGAYYFMEDVVAVNAGAGRPYREALAARCKASPRFRRMLHIQSLFWSIPAIILAIPLTVIAVIHDVPATAAYGICES